jgi:hypothetical protein
MFSRFVLAERMSLHGTPTRLQSKSDQPVDDYGLKPTTGTKKAEPSLTLPSAVTVGAIS